jgi:hypothetical protein
VLAGASSSSTRGSEFSSYSTSAGRVELNNSTITRLRATHRGQCRIAVRHGRTSMLRPHRGQFRCPQRTLASTCMLVLIGPPTGLGRRQERSATPVVWRRTRSEGILCGCRWLRSFGERRTVGRWWHSCWYGCHREVSRGHRLAFEERSKLLRAGTAETALIGRSDKACDEGLLTRALRHLTVQVDANASRVSEPEIGARRGLRRASVYPTTAVRRRSPPP